MTCTMQYLGSEIQESMRSNQVQISPLLLSSLYSFSPSLPPLPFLPPDQRMLFDRTAVLQGMQSHSLLSQQEKLIDFRLFDPREELMNEESNMKD